MDTLQEQIHTIHEMSLAGQEQPIAVKIFQAVVSEDVCFVYSTPSQTTNKSRQAAQ